MSEAISSGIDIMYRGQTKVNKEDYDAYVNRWEAKEKEEKMMEDKSTLSFTDMLSLMVAQFQNQTIDNQADASDMMNQLVQMTVVQAMTAMTTQMEEVSLANVMNYSASLVGKEVTIGVYDDEGNLEEIYGTVTATGTYDGQQVIFLGDKSYLLSSIMAVGKLPPPKEDVEPGEDPDKVDDNKPVEDPDKTTEDSKEDADPDGTVNKSEGTQGA